MLLGAGEFGYFLTEARYDHLQRGSRNSVEQSCGDEVRMLVHFIPHSGGFALRRRATYVRSRTDKRCQLALITSLSICNILRT